MRVRYFETTGAQIDPALTALISTGIMDERIANDGIDDITDEALSSELSRYEPLEVTLVVNGQSLYTTEILTSELIPVT